MQKAGFAAAAEIHKIGDYYYYAGTWSDHSDLIQQVPRRYNVPHNQTYLLRSDKPDGSSAVAIKQPITPFWDTRVGADLNVTTKMPTTSSEVLAEKMAHNNQISQSSGSAWAAMTAPGLGSIWDKTAVEARTD